MSFSGGHASCTCRSVHVPVWFRPGSTPMPCIRRRCCGASRRGRELCHSVRSSLRVGACGRWRGGASRCSGISIQGRMRNPGRPRGGGSSRVARGEFPRGAVVAEHGERPSILQLRSHSCLGWENDFAAGFTFSNCPANHSLSRSWPSTKFSLDKIIKISSISRYSPLT